MTTVQKLTCHKVFTSFWGMGDCGAAPMQVEIVKDNAYDPTDEFIEKGSFPVGVEAMPVDGVYRAGRGLFSCDMVWMQILCPGGKLGV